MMKFNIIFTSDAKEQFDIISKSRSKHILLKSLKKTLGLMETNLRQPSLQTHVFHNKKSPSGEKIFESYVQNNTPGAYRIFWYYGPEPQVITIFAILPHP